MKGKETMRRNMVPIIAALGGGLTAFAYLRLVGEATTLARLGLFVATALGGIVSLVLARRFVR